MRAKLFGHARVTHVHRRADRVAAQVDANAIFTTLGVGALNAANFRSSTNGTAGDTNDFILYNSTNGALLYDADGSGALASVQFASLAANLAITAADLMVI